MDAYRSPDAISTEFRWECSTRRTARVLELKRQRILEDLRQTLEHMALIVPSPNGGDREGLPTEVLQDALERLGDDAFAEFAMQVLKQ
ncbi:MAG: hypothetical protein SWY16_13465 [Cyanobacteriota bacterium]|nr:hypothetical protein [Cyanobacteriota bacterium]